MLTTGQKLKAAREKTGLSAATVANRLGVARSRVYAWEKDENISLDNLKALGRIYKVSFDYLLLGDRLQGITEAPAKYETRQNKAPLISYVQAGQFKHTAVNEYDDHELYPAPKGVERAYALKVIGDSMTSPNYPAERSYPDGCIIIVDADAISPDPGDDVIAKINGSDETTFKQFKRNENGKPYLRPRNPQFSMIHDEFRVLGTVVWKLES